MSTLEWLRTLLKNFFTEKEQIEKLWSNLLFKKVSNLGSFQALLYPLYTHHDLIKLVYVEHLHKSLIIFSLPLLEANLLHLR